MIDWWYIRDVRANSSSKGMQRFRPRHAAILPNKALSFRTINPRILPQPLELYREMFMEWATSTNRYYNEYSYLLETFRRHPELGLQ